MLLSNKHIPLHIKKYILIYFVLALVNYFAPLLGSNTSKAQTIINNGIYVFIVVLVLKVRILLLVFLVLRKNFLFFPFLLGVQLPNANVLTNGKKSSCVIGLLINNISTMKDFYTWILKKMMKTMSNFLC